MVNQMHEQRILRHIISHVFPRVKHVYQTSNGCDIFEVLEISIECLQKGGAVLGAVNEDPQALQIVHRKHFN